MNELLEYDFVQQPNQDYFCVVTLELLRDPHQTTCCGHHLSQEASRRLQRDGKPCPICQRPNLSTVPDIYFRRIVNEIKVCCPQKSQGCKWVGEVGSLDTHLGSQCLLVRVRCPKSCGGSVLRGSLRVHLDADCPKRNYRCKYCQFQDTYEVVQKQHLPQCPKMPVQCPNQCEIHSLEHCNLEKHLSECPLQLVECEFSQAGCKEKVPRRDLASHVRKNAQQHLLSMSLLNLTLTRELRGKMEEKDRQITELQEELKQQGHHLEKIEQRIQQQLQEMKQEELKRQGYQLEQQIQQSQQQLKRLEHLQQRGQQETRQQLIDIQCQLSGGLSCHDIVLTEFSKKKANNVDWFSNPFYSQGYRFSLSILSFEDGTHVSAFLQLEVGKNDHDLQWPFVCDAQLLLLDQQGGHDHHVATFHREFGKGNRGSLYIISTKFIAHSDLAPKYLEDDDCLRFRLYITAAPI